MENGDIINHVFSDVFGSTSNQESQTLLSNTMTAQDNMSIYAILREQFKQEEMNSRLYKNIAIWLDMNGYKCAKVWNKFSDEEREHAKQILDYFITNTIPFTLPSLEEQQLSITCLMDVITITYNAENNNLVKLQAMYDGAKDYITKNNDIYLDNICRDMIDKQYRDIKEAKDMLSISMRTADTLYLDEYLANNF